MDVLLQVGKDGELQSSGVDHEIVKFVCLKGAKNSSQLLDDMIISELMPIV